MPYFPEDSIDVIIEELTPPLVITLWQLLDLGLVTPDQMIQFLREQEEVINYVNAGVSHAGEKTVDYNPHGQDILYPLVHTFLQVFLAGIPSYTQQPIQTFQRGYVELTQLDKLQLKQLSNGEFKLEEIVRFSEAALSEAPETRLDLVGALTYFAAYQYIVQGDTQLGRFQGYTRLQNLLLQKLVPGTKKDRIQQLRDENHIRVLFPYLLLALTTGFSRQEEGALTLVRPVAELFGFFRSPFGRYIEPNGIVVYSPKHIAGERVVDESQTASLNHALETAAREYWAATDHEQNPPHYTSIFDFESKHPRYGLSQLGRELRPYVLAALNGIQVGLMIKRQITEPLTIKQRAELYDAIGFPNSGPDNFRQMSLRALILFLCASETSLTITRERLVQGCCRYLGGKEVEISSSISNALESLSGKGYISCRDQGNPPSVSLLDKSNVVWRALNTVQRVFRYVSGGVDPYFS
ncbi:hypothetical protein JW930_05295 [Candidatus Woesearchaeota archaeon]|nr:hypothetical protein [Candidatus Woesearchaeota archaeon]